MKQIDFNQGIGGVTKLEGANKLRWALCGKLNRNAALLGNTASQYPDIASALHVAMAAIREEIASITKQYEDYKKAAIAKESPKEQRTRILRDASRSKRAALSKQRKDSLI